MQGERLIQLGLITIVFISWVPGPASSISCICAILKNSFKCPPKPSCCESGAYTLDECGCCQKCAKAELQTCGGGSDSLGKCGAGLQCLKTCVSCKTVGDSGLPCIFPFIYDGRTYDKCTTRDSDTGQPWCATKVENGTNHVIDYAWGDCVEGCPGTNRPCDDRYFSIEEGKCIDVSVPGAIPNWIGAPVVKLEKPTEFLTQAPVCKNKGPTRSYKNTCRCDRGPTALDFDLLGAPRGNCTGLDDDKNDGLDKVWCFLENIRDPENPMSGCYSDTKWSAKDGRYWSGLACTQDPDVHGDQGDPLAAFNRKLLINNQQFTQQPQQIPSQPPRFSPTTNSPTVSIQKQQTIFPEAPRTSQDFDVKPQVTLDNELFETVYSDYEYPEDEDLDQDPSQEDYYYDYPSLFQEDTTQRSQSTPFQRPQSTERSATTETSVLQEEPEPTTGTIVTNI